MNNTPKAVVDGVIAARGPLDDRVLLLDEGLWNAFLGETGLQPETGEEGKRWVLYNGFELRPTAIR